VSVQPVLFSARCRLTDFLSVLRMGSDVASFHLRRNGAGHADEVVQRAVACQVEDRVAAVTS
jgi:hypothetical protein